MTTIIFKNTDFLLQSSGSDIVNEFICEFSSLLPDWVEEGGGVERILSPKFIFSEIWASLSGSGGRIGRFILFIILSMLVCYISSLYESKLTAATVAAVCVISLAPAGFEIFAIAAEVAEGLGQIRSFFGSLIPLLLSVEVAGGGTESAAVAALQMSAIASVTEILCSEILLPLVWAMIALGGFSALGGGCAERVLSVISSLFTKGLGFACAVVSAIFALQSLIATAADTAALRLAKFTAQSILPSVGTVITASMSTLSSGLVYARGVIGTGAIGVILWIMLSPLVILLSYRLALNLAVGFSQSLEVKPCATALKAIRRALDGLISLFLISGVLFIFQLVIFIKGGAEV